MTPENFSIYIDDVVKVYNIDLDFSFLHRGLDTEKRITWGYVIEVIKEYEDNFEYCIKILKNCEDASDIQATLMFIFGTLVRFHHIF